MPGGSSDTPGPAIAANTAVNPSGLTATTRYPVRRAFCPIALGMRHLTIEREIVAWPQVAHTLPHGKPHLAVNDERLQGKLMRVRLQDRGRGPLSFHYLIETLRTRLGRKRF